MLRQMPRDRADSVRYRLFIVSLLELRFHRAADLLPLRPGLCVDAAVGDDLHVALREQEVDQHAVVVLGIPDPKLGEDFQGAPTRAAETPPPRNPAERPPYGPNPPPPPSRVNGNAIPPAKSPPASVPTSSHASAPTIAPVMAPPRNRPSVARSRPPATSARISRIGSACPTLPPSEVAAFFGAGRGSPSMTPIIASTPALTPP